MKDYQEIKEMGEYTKITREEFKENIKNEIGYKSITSLGYNANDYSFCNTNGCSVYYTVEVVVCVVTPSVKECFGYNVKKGDKRNVTVRSSDHYSNLERICGGVVSDRLSLSKFVQLNKIGAIAPNNPKAIKMAEKLYEEHTKKEEQEEIKRAISQARYFISMQIVEQKRLWAKNKAVKAILDVVLPIMGYAPSSFTVANCGEYGYFEFAEGSAPTKTTKENIFQFLTAIYKRCIYAVAFPASAKPRGIEKCDFSEIEKDFEIKIGATREQIEGIFNAFCSRESAIALKKALDSVK